MTLFFVEGCLGWTQLIFVNPPAMSKFKFLDDGELSAFELKVESGETALWKYWDEFADAYLKEGRSVVTVERVRDVLRFFVRRVGLYSIEQCNDRKSLYNLLFASKEQFRWSNVTLNTYRKNLGTYFRWLFQMKYIDVNEVAEVRKVLDEMKEQPTLSHEEVNILRLQLQSRRQKRFERLRNTLFIELMIFTGARPCELLQLECRDILEEKQGYKLVIRGRKQKGRHRYYRLSSSLRDIFERYVDWRQNSGRWETNLFISQSKRTGWTDRGMRGLFKRLSKEVGFRVTAYMIRRYVATQLNSSGRSLEEIANYLGHTRTTTTKRYIERSCALTDECAKVMGG